MATRPQPVGKAGDPLNSEQLRFAVALDTLRHDLASSQAIGYQATQQNAAYNHAVDVLNREPYLPKRSGRNHPDALNKRITVWRQADRDKTGAPYYVCHASTIFAGALPQIGRYRKERFT